MLHGEQRKRTNAMQGSKGEKRSRESAKSRCYGDAGETSKKKWRDSSDAAGETSKRNTSNEAGEASKRRKAAASMINNPACSDVQFIAQDGVKVWANKAILAQASSLFCAMLTNGVTLDSTSSSVPLPSIPSAALLPILEFLYTGSPSFSSFPLSLSSAPLVLEAARFLLLPTLEQSVGSFIAQSLLSLLSQDSITPSDAPSTLSRALDMCIPHTHDVLSKLTSLIPDALLLDPKALAHFSQEGLSFYLQKTRSGSLRLDGSEYPRLRCVLLWCATSMSSSELVELLCKCLPVSEELALASRDQSTLLKKFKLFRDDVTNALEPWLSHLDLFRIHPDVLTETILPLDVVSQSYLINVLAFQVHFSKDMLYLRWKSQALSDSNTPMQTLVLDEGHSIKCQLIGDDMARSFTRLRLPGTVLSHLSMPPRFARAELPITPAMRFYEWDFVIEKDCSFMAVGFCSEQALSVDNSCSSTWLGYEPFGWVLYHSGQLFHDSKVGSPYCARFGVESRIRVHIDMVYFTCRFTVNSKTYGVAWKNIPKRIYPAVALTFPGKVRIEAASNERQKKLLTCLSMYHPHNIALN
ncbi:hypothetical protein L7F22_050910 [Adiantum nelumboides]|nr:hypothetical protein [Adiantum nelumboides]